MINRTFFKLLILCGILASCNPSINITSSYVNHDIVPKTPYKSIFVFAITQDQHTKLTAENRMAKLLESRGKKVVKSSDLFKGDAAGEARLSVDMNVGTIKNAGCDAILTMALVDVQSNESYNPGTAYLPTGPVGNYGYYGSFLGYYGYMAPLVRTPGFYSGEKTYFMETNFYDMASDKLLWRIKSATYNPGSFELWFQDYSGTILSQLKKEGLIKK